MIEVGQLPITADWTPVAYREGKTKPNPHGGMLTAFYVDFALQNGEQISEVYWQRKQGSGIEVNKPVYGTIMQGNYGPRFKMEQRDEAQHSLPQQAAPPQDPVGLQAAADRIAMQPDPEVERQRKIMRQHSQEMALRFIALTGDAQDLTLDDQALVGQYLNERVKRLTDWFVKDLG